MIGLKVLLVLCLGVAFLPSNNADVATALVKDALDIVRDIVDGGVNVLRIILSPVSILLDLLLTLVRDLVNAVVAILQRFLTSVDIGLNELLVGITDSIVKLTTDATRALDRVAKRAIDANIDVGQCNISAAIEAGTSLGTNASVGAKQCVVSLRKDLTSLLNNAINDVNGVLADVDKVVEELTDCQAQTLDVVRPACLDNLVENILKEVVNILGIVVRLLDQAVRGVGKLLIDLSACVDDLLSFLIKSLNGLLSDVLTCVESALEAVDKAL